VTKFQVGIPTVLIGHLALECYHTQYQRRQTPRCGGIMMKVIFVFVLLSLVCTTAGAAVKVPDPPADETLAPSPGEKTAVLAGGCFWGVQAVFQHVKGVKVVWAGYSGGPASSANYETVQSGRTGHAESVQISYDPSQITYGQLLKIFFSVAHDP